MRKYECMPIRTGCFVEFRQTLRNGYQRICSGYVSHHEYNEDGRHIFTVQSHRGPASVKVAGIQLYQNLLKHVPGEASRIDARRARKRYKREKKATDRRCLRQKRKPKRKRLRG